MSSVTYVSINLVIFFCCNTWVGVRDLIVSMFIPILVLMNCCDPVVYAMKNSKALKDTVFDQKNFGKLKKEVPQQVIISTITWSFFELGKLGYKHTCKLELI